MLTLKDKIIIVCFGVFLLVLFAGSILLRPHLVSKNTEGEVRVDLEAGQKLEDIVWQDGLWYLTRPMREGETAEVYFFQQYSDSGPLEQFVIVEHSFE